MVNKDYQYTRDKEQQIVQPYKHFYVCLFNTFQFLISIFRLRLRRVVTFLFNCADHDYDRCTYLLT